VVSVVIPVFKEPYLNKTIQSLLDNAEGEIEILPVFDGVLADEPLPDDPRVRPIYLARHQGMRACTNTGVERALGDWVMKCDAHCVFCPGWDKMVEDTQYNWLMVPRRYSLKESAWDRDENRPVVDYHFLSFPGDAQRSTPKYGYSIQVMNTAWKKPAEIDDTMTFQGSCWLAHRAFFMNNIFPLDDKNYGPFAQEQQEIGLKYWLVLGGAVKVNKRFWYAHLNKRKRHYDSGEFSPKTKTAEELKKYNEWLTKHWLNNEEPNMIHDFKWLVEKFNPPGWDKWETRWLLHSAK